MRHGETDTNRNHIWQGSQDIPLNATGRKQAEEAAIIVKHINPEFVITSNLSRAIETGEIAAKYAGEARFIIEPELRERGCGEVEGMTTSEIAEKFGIRMNMTSRELDNIPGAEPYKAFEERVLSTIQKIYTEYAGRKVLLVSHGGVLRTFHETTLGNLPSGIAFGNCAILSLRFDSGRWTLVDKHNTMQI